MSRTSLGLWLLFEGVQCGQYCKQYISEYRYYYRTYYCEGRCCGSAYDDDCCEDRSSYIAAAVIGSIIGFLLLAAIIVCMLKACSRSYNGGRVVNPSPNVFVVNGVSHYGRQTYNGPMGTFTIPQPPPYTAGPAPPYSPNGRKDRFEPRPCSTNSLPPAYSPGLPQAGTSSNPELHQPQPQPPSQMNPQPQVGPEVPNHDQPSHPPPAYNSLDTARGSISQDYSGHPSAHAAVVDNLPSVSNPTGGSGS